MKDSHRLLSIRQKCINCEFCLLQSSSKFLFKHVARSNIMYNELRIFFYLYSREMGICVTGTIGFFHRYNKLGIQMFPGKFLFQRPSLGKQCFFSRSSLLYGSDWSIGKIRFIAEKQLSQAQNRPNSYFSVNKTIKEPKNK